MRLSAVERQEKHLMIFDTVDGRNPVPLEMQG